MGTQTTAISGSRRAAKATDSRASVDDASTGHGPGRRGAARRTPGARTSSPGKTAHTSIWERPGFLVRRLHQIHVAMFVERLAAGNVTPIQYGLLSILLDSPGLDQFSLGEELGIDRANVADVLKRLESRGLLTRTVDAANRRRNLCHLTPAGVTFVRRYRADMHEVQQQFLAPLTPAERDTFMALLLKLIETNNGRGRAALRPQGRHLSQSSALVARRQTDNPTQAEAQGG